MRRAYVIPDEESFATARALLRDEGILAGSSSGTLVAAALRWCREQTTAKRAVTFVCDSGNKPETLDTVKSFLSYAASDDGQKILTDAGYAPIPAEINSKVRETISSLS